MEFCFFLATDPIELLQESDFTPLEIEHEDVVEVTKYMGKSTIRYGEAFFVSLRKAIHISFLNGQKYLVCFDRSSACKYTVENGKVIRDLMRSRTVPQSIDEILERERILFGNVSTTSMFVPISRPTFRGSMHSAPL